MKNLIGTFSGKTAILALPLLLGACSANMSHTPQVVTGRPATIDGYTNTLASVDRGGACVANPCDVYFQTPPGEGDIRLVVNGFDLGSFPRGERVSLGSYTEQVRIQMPGTDYKTVYVNIPRANTR